MPLAQPLPSQPLPSQSTYPYSFLQFFDPLSTTTTTMDFSSKSPRRELQGPRPTPLRVRKDSHKIRKPPVVPQQQQSQQPQVHRPPVIIYTVSPKIIHANPNEFMQLVQRLTGPNSSTVNSSSSPVSSSSYFFQENSGAISPAARFASLEKIKSPEGNKILSQGGYVDNIVGGVDISADIDRITGLFPGILSPGPSSLQPIPSNFFPPPSDPNPLGFFHDLSPMLHSNKNYLEGCFMPSPSSNVLSPNITYSPTPSLDIFNNFFDY